jgi:lipopolysaccharide transport system ATP-binding protein
MDKIAIRVQDLSKRYRIGAHPEVYQTVRETIGNTFIRPFRFLQRLKNPHSAFRIPRSDCIWALREVSFEVKKGEVVGIIGRNGAGKSTLLKILSRITEPTGGRVEIHGRVGSLLEVGTGFHRELSGRENIFLSGAILGMRRAEIQKKFDEIVAFAEVEKFLDTPLKHYSTGMFLRLAFAVAAHLETEILLVDEVLAVGDASFQRKCLGKMKETSREGRTVLFVSHQLSSITSLCSRAIQIHQGRLLDDGEPEAVVRQYLTEIGDQLTPERLWRDPESRPGNEQFRLAAIRVLNGKGEFQKFFRSRESIVVEMEFELLAEPPDLFVGFDLIDQNGVLLFRSCHNHGPDPEWPKLHIGWNKLQTTLPLCLFNHNTYYVAPRVGLNFIQWIVFHEAAVNFEVQMDHFQSSFWNGTHTMCFPGAIAPYLTWKEAPLAKANHASSSPSE